MKLVVASNNPGKLREFGALLSPLGWEAVAQKELGVPECEEPHHTFVGNATLKAVALAPALGEWVIGEDSGLVVPALGGAPGVYSARFAGEPKSDTRNNQKLVADLAGQADRRAHYVCVLVFVRHADDPQPIIAEGEWHGEIVDVPRGAGGFGYDPYFFLPALGKTAAELDADEKNRCSHRGLALQHLIERLQARR